MGIEAERTWIDPDWLELITRAKQIGLSIEEIRTFITKLSIVSGPHVKDTVT